MFASDHTSAKIQIYEQLIGKLKSFIHTLMRSIWAKTLSTIGMNLLIEI